MVHRIQRARYDVDTTVAEPYLKDLDGDSHLVQLVDKTPDGGRLVIQSGSGRAIKPDHLPTKVERRGPSKDLYPLREIDFLGRGLMVPQRFKDIVEALEPGVHQFFPMDFLYRGERQWQAYLFIICQRLDSLHSSTSPRMQRGFIDLDRLDAGEPLHLVFSKTVIAGKHAWCDKFYPGDFVSDALAERLQDANLSGLYISERFPEA